MLNSTKAAVTVREDQVMVVQGAFGAVGTGVISSDGAVTPGAGAVTVRMGTSSVGVLPGGTMSIISGFLGT